MPCARPRRCSPANRTPAPARPPRGWGSAQGRPAQIPGQRPAPLTTTTPSPPLTRTPTRTPNAAAGKSPSGCKPALRPSAEQHSPPDELATALAERTTLHAEVIARLTRADIEERVAAGAERARAADLDHADDHRATRRDTLIADTASAHESEDRAVARLAAESFPCTAADGIRAAVTGSLQQPARPAPRMTTTQNTRCPAP